DRLNALYPPSRTAEPARVRVPSAPQPGKPLTGTLSGIVVDRYGGSFQPNVSVKAYLVPPDEPAPQQRVRAPPPPRTGAPVASAASDASGRFYLENLERPARYAIRVDGLFQQPEEQVVTFQRDEESIHLTVAAAGALDLLLVEGDTG